MSRELRLACLLLQKMLPELGWKIEGKYLRSKYHDTQIALAQDNFKQINSVINSATNNTAFNLCDHVKHGTKTIVSEEPSYAFSNEAPPNKKAHLVGIVDDNVINQLAQGYQKWLLDKCKWSAENAKKYSTFAYKSVNNLTLDEFKFVENAVFINYWL